MALHHRDVEPNGQVKVQFDMLSCNCIILYLRRTKPLGNPHISDKVAIGNFLHAFTSSSVMSKYIWAQCLRPEKKELLFLRSDMFWRAIVLFVWPWKPCCRFLLKTALGESPPPPPSWHNLPLAWNGFFRFTSWPFCGQQCSPFSHLLFQAEVGREQWISNPGFSVIFWRLYILSYRKAFGYRYFCAISLWKK